MSRDDDSGCRCCSREVHNVLGVVGQSKADVPLSFGAPSLSPDGLIYGLGGIELNRKGHLFVIILAPSCRNGIPSLNIALPTAIGRARASVI